uniref:Uncharacterized protein n=1 Tax=uncultured gamma proteobacterium HF0070_03O15 TaxID=710982 RepID=E0XRR3_9GAMM|nr:hypothetical protein [uncultured gamma proteobacterium HF0070_03O15]
MAFLLDGKPLAVDVPFTYGDIHYPANWLRLSTAQEKKDLGITEVADAPTYDSRFYNGDGSAKTLTDTNATDENGDLLKDENGDQVVILGVKSILKAQEKATAGSLLAKYDWYVIRKTEKDTAIPSAITTYRDAVRTACNTRETEIDNCADTAALVTLYGVTTDSNGKFVKYNMTQYPVDPNE